MSKREPRLPAPPVRLPRRTDWQTWLPAGVAEPRTITRAALLDRLKQRNLLVTERELRYWESQGALPTPMRQYRDGGTHALYPSWHYQVVEQVPSLRGQGLGWAEIGDRLRDLFAGIAQRQIFGEWETEKAPPLPAELVTSLQRFMAQINHDHEHGARFAILQIYPDRAGEPIEYPLFAPARRAEDDPFER